MVISIVGGIILFCALVPLKSYVISGKSQGFSEPLDIFYTRGWGDNLYLIGSLRIVNEIVIVKFLIKCLAHNKNIMQHIAIIISTSTFSLLISALA